MRKLFRTVGLLEALSFLILLGIAMPMKYMYAIPKATFYPGLAHGLLFVFYIVLAHALADRESWTGKKLALAYIASVLPLGTIAFDRKFMTPADGS